MRAAVFDTDLSFVHNYPVPVPEEGEALVRIRMAGICNTDLEIIKGYQGFRGIIGHEFVGVVEEVNASDKSWKDRRVVGEINCRCGECEYCMRGLGNHCTRRRVLGIGRKDGAMADYITLPVRNLFEVPETIPDDLAVLTEPLAAAFRIPEQVHITSPEKVLVLGDGKIGILCALVLGLSHPGVILAGKHESKLKIAAAQGIETVRVDEMDLAKRYDLVVDATGHPDGFATACNLVKPRGTIVLKSTVAGQGQTNLSSVVVDEITVIGSRCGPFGPALRALEERTIDARPLISGVFPFGKAADAFSKAREKRSLKILLDFR